MKVKITADEFDAPTWARYQCQMTSELFPKEFAEQTKTAPCDANNFATIQKAILTDANFATLGADFDTAKRMAGTAADGYFFLPQLTVENVGTTKLLHMTFVF